MLSTLHAGVSLPPRICPLCTQPHSHPAAPPVLSGSFCWMLGGPRSAHANAHLCSREHTFSASRAAGGEPPLLKVHSGVIHPRTNSAARAAGGESPLPGCTHAPRASGDTRLDSHACLTPRSPHICIASLPLPLAPQGRWQFEKLSGPPMCAVLARNALSRQMHTGFFFFSPVMPHIMANTRCAHWHSYPHRAARATTGAYAAQCSPTPSPPYDPYSIGPCGGDSHQLPRCPDPYRRQRR